MKQLAGDISRCRNYQGIRGDGFPASQVDRETFAARRATEPNGRGGLPERYARFGGVARSQCPDNRLSQLSQAAGVDPSAAGLS